MFVNDVKWTDVIGQHSTLMRKDQIEKLNEYLSISTKIKDRNENHAKIFHDQDVVDGKNDVIMWHSVGLRILVIVFKNSLKVSCLKYFGIMSSWLSASLIIDCSSDRPDY